MMPNKQNNKVEKDYLLLKWGTAKDWSGVHTPEALKWLKKWHKAGVSMSLMMQEDTPKQKEYLCKAIDALNGQIQNDWDGEFYTKRQAKKYIMNYDQQTKQ